MIGEKRNNYAFIDSQNVNLAIRSQGWKLDLHRFRVHLKDKYNVRKALFFVGYIPGNESLYKEIQEADFICMFKPTLELPDGSIKGNVDVELVMHTMIELMNFDKAVLVSGDGDFQCLIRHLISNDKLEVLLLPDQSRTSALLKVFKMRPFIRSMKDLRKKLEKEKAP